MNRLIILAAASVLTLAACSKPAEKAPAAPPAAAPVKVEIPAGDYTLDPEHSTVLFKLSHLGFSNYTAQFAKFEAKLTLDPANLEAAHIEVMVDPRSLSLPSPPEGFKDELLGDGWLDASRYSTITYKSTHIQPTGPDSALITGDLSLHGVTKPLVLQAKFNGGYAGHPMDPHARAGFSATGAFKRSDFGMAFGVPAPGTKMGVSDEVQVVIETEFTGPPLKQ
jgi:polyisoprenoid-binding protein YceI